MNLSQKITSGTMPDFDEVVEQRRSASIRAGPRRRSTSPRHAGVDRDLGLRRPASPGSKMSGNTGADREGTPIARSSTVHHAADHERSAPRSRPTIGRPLSWRHRPCLHRPPRIRLDEHIAVDLDELIQSDTRGTPAAAKDHDVRHPAREGWSSAEIGLCMTSGFAFLIVSQASQGAASGAACTVTWVPGPDPPSSKRRPPRSLLSRRTGADQEQTLPRPLAEAAAERVVHQRALPRAPMTSRLVAEDGGELTTGPSRVFHWTRGCATASGVSLWVTVNRCPESSQRYSSSSSTSASRTNERMILRLLQARRDGQHLDTVFVGR